MELTSLLIYIGIFVTLFLLAILFSDGDLTVMISEKFGKRLSKLSCQVNVDIVNISL